jgi:hypothetical protein
LKSEVSVPNRYSMAKPSWQDSCISSPRRISMKQQAKKSEWQV